jgi:uncharacterized protein (DUF302 family)
MLRVNAEHTLDKIELALRNAAQRHGANVISVVHLGQLLRDKEHKSARDAIVFTICQPELSAALLEADIRFAAFVPCRIAAFEEGGAVTLEALSPGEICRLLNRPDLKELTVRLETALRGIMEGISQPLAPAHTPAAERAVGVGAMEDQVYARGSIPQRIDCHGTKVEELAGTGQHDSPGG